MADGDGATVDLRTVFVKGVSFDWDDKTFEGAFSNIGPLRKCFLLKGAGKQHKVLYSLLGQGNYLHLSLSCVPDPPVNESF